MLGALFRQLGEALNPPYSVYQDRWDLPCKELGLEVALSGEARIEVEGHSQRVCRLIDSGNGFDITCVVRGQ